MHIALTNGSKRAKEYFTANIPKNQAMKIDPANCSQYYE
ncbi:hypothetical protein F926_02032 [Acinetobacter haemolyticus NIPH 261]|nr:hypothetical protein F926_02032 [Acinetobacter haemolyticus NIPH 261]